MKQQLFHSLAGKHIAFKELSTADTKEIHNYASDIEVSRFIGWSLMNSLDDTKKHIERMINREAAGTHLYASIVQKSTQEIVGTAMIFHFDHEANQAEIGYVFHRDHWGKGYGTECVALISDYAFETLNLHKLHASVVDANVGSARILEKNGYEVEGELRDHYFIDETYYNALLFGKIQTKKE
ncbi:GNAT family N-acetyltransferase [Neobacillus sp. OS1-2]|uniref:GNAT family N-acetyltransferase n=1 Tax=Neobacillus sp. OS1-2 TaxID=3070680 RepID=UPI0027E02C1F|nr:GNAT family N-acetyltransferase [Neobacillus sp. OS1-2]WML39661.1 GNAT family N-acetyltransferase [Neobacillus sp. OS1-2]